MSTTKDTIYKIRDHACLRIVYNHPTSLGEDQSVASDYYRFGVVTCHICKKLPNLIKKKPKANLLLSQCIFHELPSLPSLIVRRIAFFCIPLKNMTPQLSDKVIYLIICI